MNSNTFSLLTTIASVLIGSGITWLFAWLYYVRAGKELIQETKEIRKLINCMIILQKDEKGQYTPKLDADGKLVTIYGNMSANLQGNSSFNADIDTKK